ncbi:hypothetical protein ACQ4PT_025864 [Festuca glaucescens]
MAGAGHELKLVGMWASPFVTRVKLALHLKGLSYDYVEEDLGSKSELLLPRAQDGARPHPRRQARLRVAHHSAVHRRGLRRRGRRQPATPTRRPLRARDGPLLGGLHRRQGAQAVAAGVQRQDGRGEGRVDGSGSGGGGRSGGSARRG